MSQPADNHDDPRLAALLEVIFKFAAGDLTARGTLSDDNSALDGVMAGINILGEELEAYVAENKQTHDALAQALDYANTLIRSSPDGVLAVDLDFRITEWNLLMEQMCGKSRAQMIGQRLDEIPLMQETGEAARIRQGLEGENIGAREVAYRMPGEDRERFFESLMAPLRGPAGQILGAVLRVREITERKRAQQALAESEALLRSIFDSVQDGIILADAKTRRFRMVNASICRMLGYSHDELLNLGVEDIHPKDDLAYVVHQFERMTTGAISVAPNIPMQEKNGTVFYADVNSGQLTVDGVAFLVGVFRDITERKRAEDQVRSASLYARSLIEASLDPLATISVAGAIMDVNEAAAQITGVPRERLTGSDFSSYFTEPDKAHAAYQEAFTKGTVRNYPLTMRHVSGKLTDVLYNASVYHNEKGELAGVLAVARDITERNRAEQAEELARRDGLTGLYNHRTFYSFLNDEIIRTQRHNRPVSLLMLDIDHFKHVNDTHGHQAGDAILRGLSDLLAQQARAVDRVCRYGGEEIMVILPETGAAMAMNIAERLRMEVAQQPFDIGGGKTTNITASIGVATYPQQVNSLEALVKAADVALYAAKQGGRNRVCRYEPEMAGDDPSA